MKRILGHPLTLTLAALGALYLLFAHGIQPPLPRSLLIQFMVFATIGVLMVATFDDAVCARLFAPLQALFGAPGLMPWRMLALVLAVSGAAAAAYGWAKPTLEAPIELRTVHPAPPSSFRAYGRDFDPLNLKNPYREEAPKGSAAYAAVVAEGRGLYYRNCLFCHGDNLAGRGLLAPAFNPRPANFQDVGTIAQLQESYLFWRIATGAPGLPREGAPWASAMPVWNEMLKAEEIWKIITFLYDYTGYDPRTWELEAAAPAEDATTRAAPAEAGGEDAIARVYAKYCAQCHGAEGEGDGPAAEFLYPVPRDFTFAVFKYKTTQADDEFPSDDDFRGTIRRGLPGTAMPAWEDILSPAEIDGLIRLIKTFGEWDEEDFAPTPIDLGERIESTADSIARGARLFEKACVQCHGNRGRGNITSGKKLKDDSKTRIWPRNLTRPETWRWTADAGDVFQRISTGIRGTPMPEHTTTLSTDKRWDIANYVMTLDDKTVPFNSGETVLRGTRVTGPLPDDADDPAWAAARATAFPLVPNVIKEPRLFHSLNDSVEVRVLFNDETIAIRLDIDDRSYSVPGDPLELRYRQDGVEPTADAAAIQFPGAIPTTSEKPWFRHGDGKHPVTMWYWRAPSIEPAAPEQAILFDSTGPDAPPVARDGAGISAGATWRDGRWRIVLSRALVSDDNRDIAFETGRYIPIAFANWDGWAGHSGGRHTMTPWYWLLLPPDERPLLVYGASGGSGLLAGVLFLFAAHRQRRKFARPPLQE